MIRITKRLLFLLLFCCCCKILFAQSKKIDSLLSVLKTAKDDTSKVNTLNALSLQLTRKANYSESKKYADDALLLAQKLNFKKGIANAHLTMGNYYFYQESYPEALKFFLAALKMSEEIGSKQEIANSYNNVGLIYLNQDNDPEALKNLLAALKIREEIGNKQQIANSYNNIGIIYFDQTNYPEALKNYLAALKIREDIGDKQNIALSFRNIGNVYEKQGNYAEAQKNNLASLKIYEEIGDKQEIADCYLQIGVICMDQGNHPEALKNYLAALKISEETGDKLRIANGYFSIGDFYSLQGNFPEALKNNLAGLKLVEQLRDKASIAIVYIKLGRLSIKLHKPAEAKKYLDDAISLSMEMGIKYPIRDAYNALVELDSLEGNFKSAYENHKMYILYRDSVVNKENAVKIVGMEMQYEFDKKEAVTKLEQEKAIEATKNRSNLIMMTSAILIISSLFIILLIRQRNSKKRAIEKATTAHKMAELELQSLRTQLNPHFMFNSLNSIQELILLEENEKSQSYLARFGKLLRMLFENAESPFISLRKEMDFLQLYLGLENLRIPDLQYSISTDPTLNTEETLIPNMILQPYIENAIWHGLSHKEKDKQLQIRIYRENGIVNYEIEDNGVGRKKAAELKSLFRQKHRSKGMELLSKRFKLLNEEYSSDINTTITDVIKNNEVSGTLVRIKLPLKITEHLLHKT
jgi:tetratricopeptide (TPR) repeat protein